MNEAISEFEGEIQAFAHQEAPRHATVFYGSSSIRLWESMPRDFPGRTVVNRGFGGTTLAECNRELSRIIEPLEPAALVLYAGDNDLDQGASPEQVVEIFNEFIGRLRDRFAGLPVAFISVKPSPARYWNLVNIRRTNELVRNAAAQWPGVAFLDLFPFMLSPAGGSRPELFDWDGLHLNAEGYRLWTEHIRAWLDAIAPMP